MKLTEFLDNPELADREAKTIKRSVRISGGNSKGNSADAVLLYEAERMLTYISDDVLKKIVNKKTALKLGIKGIGSKNDVPDILQKFLIPETSDYARKKFSEFLLKEASERFKINKTFYTKNFYYVPVSYLRKGKRISYFSAFDVRTGRRIKLNQKLKKSLRRKK